ncbi:hypothetical protein NQ318_018351 [Aromia moschata]|uniref:Peptidase aspartic putative domain-containing protein n=1 Tax=Aromia moschata TaxID=1265417 RepID=A0AAV8ZDD5_9CUCU|nr:hypothetical protein NQ318_018351 [Aromia moschata]
MSVCHRLPTMTPVPFFDDESDDQSEESESDSKFKSNQQAVFPYLLKTPRDRKYGTQGHPGHRKSYSPFSGSSGAINETSDSGNTAPAEIVVPTVNALASSLSRQVALLSTALVDVHDSQGHPHTLRVLIDNGSEASFITVKAARNLNLKRQHDKIQIQGIGANSSIFSSGSIHCKISPHGSCQPAIHLEAHIIPHVASLIQISTFLATLISCWVLTFMLNLFARALSLPLVLVAPQRSIPFSDGYYLAQFNLNKLMNASSIPFMSKSWKIAQRMTLSPL